MSDFFLADDLSGALDAAAAFHHTGRRVVVALSTDAWPPARANEIVGVTTETRNLPPEQAAREVDRALAAGRARGARLVFKKIDSTLRGPVAAELAALTAALPEARVLFTPANPRVGRTVRDGLLLVSGVPVSETEFARDPVCPVRESSLRVLLGPAATPRIHIVDAAGEDDLDHAVARMEAAGGRWVAVGSGALAKAVAARWPRVDAAGHERAPGAGAAGGLLFVGGSAHRLNREQAAALARDTGIVVHDVSAAAPTTAAEGAILSLRERGAAALLAPEERTTSEIALRAIVTAALRTIDAAGVRRVFATGGETAFALCRALGITQLEFAAEIEPGLSLSRAEAPHGPMLFAVKPGGFGDARTWVRAWAELRGA